MAELDFAQWSFHFATPEGRKRIDVSATDDFANALAADPAALHRRYQQWVTENTPTAVAQNLPKPHPLPMTASEGRQQSTASTALTKKQPPSTSPSPARLAPANGYTGSQRPSPGPPAIKTTQTTSNGFATTGFILGIVSIFAFIPLIIGVPVTLSAIVFSGIGLSKFTPGQKGRWMPIVGLVLGVLYLFVGIAQTARGMA